MRNILLLTAALSLAGFGVPSAMAQSSAGAGDIQLQGAPQPTPDTPLYNLQKGQVTTDTQSAQANVEAYPSDGSQRQTSQSDQARDALAHPSDADEHQDRPTRQDRDRDFPQ